MIRNLVFDIGNVMASWNSEPLIRRLAGEDADVRDLHKKVFGSAVWHSQERGECGRAEVKAELSRLYPEQGALLAEIVDQSNTILFETENTDVVARLHALGYGTYFLSNTNDDALRFMKSRFRFFEVMDGGIGSYEVGLEKPDPEIFRTFLRKYHLAAEECVFVDDVEENVRAAESVGMRGIVLGKMSDLRGELSRLLERSDF